MIKVSHELPLCLMPYDRDLNDYDFCLPTYWFKSERYKNHFLKAKAAGRFIIADNGLFEGDSFTEQQLIEFVNELRPDIFVIPDVWNDAKHSYKNAKFWQKVNTKYLPSETKLMAVVQKNKVDFSIYNHKANKS